MNDVEINADVLEEKEQEIRALKLRIEVLEDLLQRLSTQRTAQPQAQHLLKPAPRRWSVR